MDPYKILGIEKGASREQIKKAFREKATKYHPDKGGEQWAFEQVRKAYDQLLNPSKTPKGDAMRSKTKPETPAPEQEKKSTEEFSFNAKEPLNTRRRKKIRNSIFFSYFSLFAQIIFGGISAICVSLLILWVFLKQDPLEIFAPKAGTKSQDEMTALAQADSPTIGGNKRTDRDGSTRARAGDSASLTIREPSSVRQQEVSPANPSLPNTTQPSVPDPGTSASPKESQQGDSPLPNVESNNSVTDKLKNLEIIRDAAIQKGDVAGALAAIKDLVVINGQNELEAKLLTLSNWNASSTGVKRSIAVETVQLLELAITQERIDLVTQHLDRLLILTRAVDDRDLERRGARIALKRAAQSGDKD